MRSLQITGAALLCLAAGAAVQLRTGAPLDADTAYHVAVGHMIAKHGILHAFPWTPFSWLARHYADKELAFHLAFVPLAKVDWITAARLVGALWSAAALFVLYLILRAERVRWAALWALAPLLVSPVFLYRFALVRPHQASIALAATILWAAARRRLAILAVAALVYPWFYVGWSLAVAMAILALVGSVLAHERPGWKVLPVAAIALTVGIALHPNALNLIRFAWIQWVDVLVRGAWGGEASIELGDEFRAFTAAEWTRLLPGAALVTVAALALSWRSRDPVVRAFSLAALGFALLTLRTARFAEYLVPFAVAALALAGRDFRWRSAAAAVSAVAVLASAPATASLWADITLERPHLPRTTAERLAASIPEGTQVFTCEWGHTGTLMLALPERRFMVALDPTLFRIEDPARYDLWYAIPRQPPPQVSEVIRSRFGARYVVCRWEDRFRKLFRQIATEAGVQTIVFDDWVAYDLGPIDG